MLGVTRNRHNVKVVNTLILYFKFFIFRQKLFHNCEISLLSLLAEVKMKIKTEKLIYTMQNKPSQFDGWKNILLALKIPSAIRHTNGAQTFLQLVSTKLSFWYRIYIISPPCSSYDGVPTTLKLKC